MKLSDYIEINTVNVRALAKKIGISYATFMRIMAGENHSLSIALAIEKATNGQVTVYDLAPKVSREKKMQQRKKKKESQQNQEKPQE